MKRAMVVLTVAVLTAAFANGVEYAVLTVSAGALTWESPSVTAGPARILPEIAVKAGFPHEPGPLSLAGFLNLAGADRWTLSSVIPLGEDTLFVFWRSAEP